MTKDCGPVREGSCTIAIRVSTVVAVRVHLRPIKRMDALRAVRAISTFRAKNTLTLQSLLFAKKARNPRKIRTIVKPLWRLPPSKAQKARKTAKRKKRGKQKKRGFEGQGSDRERAEYGFGEYGFEHRAQRVFRGSLSSGNLGSELSEILSAYYLCAKANSPSFSQNSPSLR